MMWKQPVPTQVPETMGDSFAETVYQKLVIRARNDKGNVYVKGDIVLLERGQCITGRYELAECFGLSKNQSGKIQRILVKLQKVYNLIDIRRHRYCSIITILNYDSVVSFEHLNEHLVDISQTSGRHLIDTNKNVESVKSVKSEKNIYNVPLRDTSPSNWKDEYGDMYINAFNKLFGTKYLPTPARKQKLKKRFEMFTADQINTALNNLAKSKFHRGENDTGWKANPDFLIKNDEMIDKWLNYTGGKYER